jgi:hypothetical protein
MSFTSNLDRDSPGGPCGAKVYGDPDLEPETVEKSRTKHETAAPLGTRADH